VLGAVGFAVFEVFAVVVAAFLAVLIEVFILGDFDLVILRVDPASTWTSIGLTYMADASLGLARHISVCASFHAWQHNAYQVHRAD